MGDCPDTQEGFGGAVSGGDAVTPGRLPEQFYEEEKPESYGTLVSYDQYSRTYHVDGNQYVTVVGNDGATYIDDDGRLQHVDNTLEKDTATVFSAFPADTVSVFSCEILCSETTTASVCTVPVSAAYKIALSDTNSATVSNVTIALFSLVPKCLFFMCISSSESYMHYYNKEHAYG